MKLLHRFLWLFMGVFIFPSLAFAQSTVTVSGRIYGFDEATVSVEVFTPQDTFSLSAVPNGQGDYSVEVPVGADVVVRPSASSNSLNGVTSLDVALLSWHYSNKELLNSAYKIIAADANNDGVISQADSLDLRKLILAFYNELPNNSSWRFVRLDYVFPDPFNPFPFPEIATVPNVTQNVGNLDFVGIKVGDLNGTAITNGPIAPPYLATTLLSGWVRADGNADCVADSLEIPLDNWVVKAVVGGKTFFGVSQSDGKYRLPVPGGAGVVELLPPNNLWQVCGGPVPFTFVPGQPVQHAFSAQALVSCPLMDVNLSARVLRRCFDNNYYKVQYCNKGTAPVVNGSVTVNLDPYIFLEESSAPYSISVVNGDSLYHFNVGQVYIGQCGQINLRVRVSCDAVLGQTHCTTAHAYPDSLCGPQAAAHPNLEITGKCANGEVKFTVKNTGTDMTNPVEYVVVEDILIQMVGGPILLGAGASEVITLPGNGSTWRLEIPQAVGHPWSTLASAAVEGCATAPGVVMSRGIVPQFPQDDAAPFEDEDCQVNVGAYDPNDKQGFPVGIGDEHAIRPGQAIDYLIRFQNTGTDTAFNIIVLDTLPVSLNPGGIQLLSSSHPCIMRLHRENILQFQFKNIMLPDSNRNEPASHGYVKFSIPQLPNVPEGTVIQNRAGIYFDFNAPIMTNYTHHTVRALVVNTSNVVFQTGVELEVYPNPAVWEVNFLVKSALPKPGTLSIFDMQGRQVLRQPYGHNSFNVDLSAVPGGTYLYRLDDGNGLLASGKLVVVKE